MVMQDGNQVAYVNELRQHLNQSLDLRLPLGGNLGVPASMAIRGFEGVVEGSDYRGIPVLAVTRKIPGTPWFLVAKIDQEEVLAPIRHEAWTAALISVLLVAATFLGIAHFWNRKRFEALHESAMRFQTMIEKAPVAVAISRNQKVIYGNQRYLDLYRYGSLNQLVGQPILGQWAPESRAMVEELVQNRMRGEIKRQEIEGVGLRKDGSRFALEATTDIIQLADGPAAMALATDISERKRAEERIRESEARFRSCFERPLIGIAITSPEKGWLAANDRACEILGYSREELYRTTWAELTHADDLTTDVREFDRMMAGESDSYAADKRYIRKDGNIIWVSLAVGCVRKVDRTVDYMCVNFQDITERKSAEEALKASEIRFRSLIENASDMVTVLDKGGIMRFSSPSVQRQLGYQPDELLNRSCFEIIHPQDRAKAASAIQDALSDPTTAVTVECRVQHRDGSWRILQTIGQNVPDMAPDGFIVLNSRDITESRALEEQFLQTQKMEGIGQLAGGVAHDFNNLLAATMMLCEMTQDMEGLPQNARRNLQDILGVAEKAANLTRQLLLFSRRQVMQTRDLDLNESVKGMTMMLQRIIGEDITITLTTHPAPLFTHADPGMLDQVLMNLSVNARDAMPEGGRLIIETSMKTLDEQTALHYRDAVPGRYACLRVTDTGTGIPPEVLPRIFEPFFTTKEAGKGTGLGLATVFGIVKQHGGWLSIESEVGKGTSFEAHFPLIEASAEAAVNRTGPRKESGGTETVLLVEDETMVRVMTGAMLEQVGYSVLEASNGVEALEKWEKSLGEVDLLLTDLVLPEGISGRQLAKKLQECKPELKVVLTSGYSAEIAGTELVPQPGQVFVQKPCSGYQILEAVRTCLDS